jgi:5'-nucleotidase
MSRPLRILLSNDDGVSAPGLAALARALRPLGEVAVIAPEHNWSAGGHSKTMHKPLRVTPARLADGSPAQASNGSPSDCVALALLGLMEKPDLVVSGINTGANIGKIGRASCRERV